MAQLAHGALRRVWQIGDGPPPLEFRPQIDLEANGLDFPYRCGNIFQNRSAETAGPPAVNCLFTRLSTTMQSAALSRPVPQHLLHRRAVHLSRQIYTSMPWGYRVAGLLLVLAADSLDAFGRTTYALFIEAVVRGMPEVSTGKAAYDLIGEVHRRGPDALPTGYGRPFASRVFKILLSKFTDLEVVEEAISHVMLQAARGKLHVRNGVDLADAEAYIITAALNAARDIVRARGRRREQSLVRENDDESTVDVEDPKAFDKLDKLMPVSELRAVLRDLGEVHPRAPEWLQARLQGDSGQEIAADWGVTPSYVSKFQRTYLPEIKKVVEHHLRQARARYSYNRRAAASG